MMALIFLLYFGVGLEIYYERNQWLKSQITGLFALSLYWFHFHTHIFAIGVVS